ncbi:MAG TPA: hypothetical protein VGA05_09275 [Candidatus Bathyarchaeia archaeon]
MSLTLTKQVLISNTMEVHNSTMGKVKAGKFFCVCGHCDHHLQSDCLSKGCWCCTTQVSS